VSSRKLSRMRAAPDFGIEAAVASDSTLAERELSFLVRLAQAALPLWRELEDAGGRPLLRITGGFDVGDPSYLRACAAALRSCGATAEELTPGARRERFPWFESDDQSIFSPDTGVIAADDALAATTEVARAAGARIEEEVQSARIDVHGEDRVEIVAHDLPGDDAVPGRFGQLGQRVP